MRNMNKKRFLRLLTLAAAVLMTACLLSGCDAPEWFPGTTEPPTTDPLEPETEATTAPIEDITMVVTETSIWELEEYPYLRTADLSGSTCYDAIEAYINRHPEVEVTYNVQICGRTVAPDVKELTFLEGEYTPAEMLAVLPYLHEIETLNFPGDSLTLDTLTEVRTLFPDAEIRYAVKIAGVVCDGGAEYLDLSFIDSSMVPSVAEMLPMLPELELVELIDPIGRSPLSMEDVELLQASAPKVVFHYLLDLFGRTVSTTDEEIYFADVNLSEIPGADRTLRRAMNLLRGVNRVVLDNCGFDNELLAQIREEYRHCTKLVWRVWFAKDGSCLTDREMIRTTFNLTSNNCHDLMYCEDCKFLDMGHNEQLYDIDFVATMPNLVAVIISGAPISDLTPFENHTKLEFLEIAFCGYVKDLSPLAGCYSLERLNVGFTKVSDLSMLDDMNMKVLVDTHTAVSNKNRNHFETVHPDCLVQHSGAQPYGYPWRYHKDMQSFNDYYILLREVFDYENGTNTHR